MGAIRASAAIIIPFSLLLMPQAIVIVLLKARSVQKKIPTHTDVLLDIGATQVIILISANSRNQD